MVEVIWYIITTIFFTIKRFLSPYLASVMISDGYLKEKSVQHGYGNTIELSSMS